MKHLDKRIVALFLIALAAALLAYRTYRATDPAKVESTSGTTDAPDSRLPKPSENHGAAPGHEVSPAPAPAPSAAPTSAEVSPVLDKSVTETIRACLGIADIDSLAGLERALESKFPGKVVRETEFENTHYRLANGEERRIRVEGAEARVFAVDAEGLPILLRRISASEAKHELEGARIERTQVGYRVHDSRSGGEVRIEEENGRIRELKWTDTNSSLGCTAETCDCIRPLSA